MTDPVPVPVPVTRSVQQYDQDGDEQSNRVLRNGEAIARRADPLVPDEQEPTPPVRHPLA